ncbi:MAG TPA: hypothetical protein VIH86_00355 [Puia sp.]
MDEIFNKPYFKMLKQTVFLVFLFLSANFSYSQTNLYPDSVNVSDSTILIATSTEYKEYEFCIEMSNEAIKELKKLTYGQEKEYSYEKFPVVIKLVTKGKITKIWSIHILSSIIEVDGKKYFFDTTLLSSLHKKYPINYVVEEKVFTSQFELDNYYQALLKDKTFLYIVPRIFGSEYIERFNLTFKKNEVFSSPEVIGNYLDPEISKLVPEGKFSIGYEPFGDAKKDSSNEFTVTIESMIEIYNSFNDTNAKKSGLIFFPSYIVRKK